MRRSKLCTQFQNVQILVLILIFFGYSGFRATRKTKNIVKGVLNHEAKQPNSLYWTRSYLEF
ncbi:hypothetical protein AXF42_Ash018036 [Apostasia shenzhenica]|uniref:Uncharacterized protein n=1 Tax=Apostasia shenzhenica TaxID=1088818 RepID=A0A2I0AVL2_9ASPA|nr:hypothetical protein AXF42_Ash018036 [Apostasia shenzhenica]